MNPRSAFSIVWLLSLFLFVSSCKPSNDPISADSQGKLQNSDRTQTSVPAPLPPRREKIWTDFEGGNALAEAKALAAFGPRPSGTDANKRVRQYLVDRLTQLGWQTTEQPFTDHPPDAKNVAFCNLIARFSRFPVSPKRILIGAHFDTLMTQEFREIGATDGAANSAILVELARVLGLDPQLAGQVELLFLDGDAPFRALNLNDGLFGSRFYSQMLRINQHASDIRAAILLRNIGSGNLNFSPNCDPKLAEELQTDARILGVKLEPANRRLLTDHAPFEQAGIPSVALLEADSPFLNTADDTTDRLNADSLAKTGNLILYFIAARTTPR